jgi:hypothetical protein
MSQEEAEERIIAILKEKGEMTSMQIDSHFKERDEECPDSLVAFLARMRRQGKIRGELSKEKRGWVWWTE